MTHTVYIAGTSEGENLANVWSQSNLGLKLEMVVKTTSINQKERSKVSCSFELDTMFS